jgi:hypothetical protein
MKIQNKFITIFSINNGNGKQQTECESDLIQNDTFPSDYHAMLGFVSSKSIKKKGLMLFNKIKTYAMHPNNNANKTI